MSLNPTSFSTPSISPSNYNLTVPTDTSILLLQTGDYLLLQDGVDSILLESGDSPKPVNYAKASLNPTNFVLEDAP